MQEHQHPQHLQEGFSQPGSSDSSPSIFPSTGIPTWTAADNARSLPADTYLDRAAAGQYVSSSGQPAPSFGTSDPSALPVTPGITAFGNEPEVASYTQPFAASVTSFWRRNSPSESQFTRSTYAILPRRTEGAPIETGMNRSSTAFPDLSPPFPASESNLAAEQILARTISPQHAAVFAEARELPKKFPDVYSGTGFDIMGLLCKVASRPNPQIQIGPVDLTCSFLVVDPQKYDCPIIYVSPTFVKLTGYSEEEIIGQNCRFLQAPDGRVEMGSCRRYTDNSAVRHLKSAICQGKESQTSIINYRKGGEPFANLVTIIPIAGDRGEIAFLVGFQIDLVEQPNAIVERMRNGTYNVNYALSHLPPYLPPAIPNDTQLMDYLRETAADALPFPATSEIVTLMGGPQLDAAVAKSTWSRMLLQNSPDFIHVMSLKGTFLYCSPAVRRLLEYEPEDLVGRSFSTICHPLDAVAVMRDLKQTASSPTMFSTSYETVALVYRIRRKWSGYIWMEAVGRFSNIKRRRCFIMSARPRPVYSLPRRFLKGLEQSAVSAPKAMELFGISAKELVATSLYQYVRPDKTTELTHALSQVRQGLIVTLRHDFRCKRGNYVEVVTTFWPGDGSNEVQPADPDPTVDTTPGIAPPTADPQALLVSQCPTTHAPVSGGNAAAAKTTNSQARRIRKWEPSFILSLTRKHSPSDVVEQLVVRNPIELPRFLEEDDYDLFELLDCARNTSWQFELHQLRLENKKLREQIEEFQQSKRRKAGRRGPATACSVER